MSDTPKRELPPLPNLEKLKREAKGRLGEMRQRMPSAQLAEAQLVLAREYGFPNWAALKAEVERRAAGPEAAVLREGKARGALFRAQRRHDVQEPDVRPPEYFFHAGMAAQMVFIVVAALGIVVVLAAGHIGVARLAPVVRHFLGLQ